MTTDLLRFELVRILTNNSIFFCGSRSIDFFELCNAETLEASATPGTMIIGIGYKLIIVICIILQGVSINCVNIVAIYWRENTGNFQILGSKPVNKPEREEDDRDNYSDCPESSPANVCRFVLSVLPDDVGRLRSLLYLLLPVFLTR